MVSMMFVTTAAQVIAMLPVTLAIVTVLPDTAAEPARKDHILCSHFATSAQLPSSAFCLI